MPEPSDVERSLPPSNAIAASPPADGAGRLASDEATELLKAVVRSVAEAAPEVWEKLSATFSMAGGEEVMQAVVLTSRQHHSVQIGSGVADLVRRHRRISTGPDGPWLRLMFECDPDGNLTVGLDYGAVELPSDYLLSPDAYRRDIAQHPRESVPTWLLAYMGNDGRQLRSAAQRNLSRGMSPLGVKRLACRPPLCGLVG